MENIDINNPNAVTIFTCGEPPEALRWYQSLEQQDQCQHLELHGNVDTSKKRRAIWVENFDVWVKLQLRRFGLLSRTLDTSRMKSFEPPMNDKKNSNVEVRGCALAQSQRSEAERT